MTIEFQKEGRIGIIKIIGRLDASNARELKDNFVKYLEEAIYFIMDFSELEFIDSTGLGAVISAFKHASEVDGDVYIANLQPKPRMVFDITRAYRIFDVYEDVDTALEAMQEKKK